MKTAKISCIIAALTPVIAFTSPLQGIHFSHKDWETVCDNTGTCRVAGYNSDSASFRRSVSVLFTRKAGANAPVSGMIQLAAPENEDGGGIKNFRFAADTGLWLNGKSLGRLRLDKNSISALSALQTQALIKALAQKNQKIEVRSGRFVWELSDAGAAAALLKADEFQQRLNTPGAWIRKGGSRHAVLQPQAKPVVRAVRVAKSKGIALDLKDPRFKRVLQLLRQANRVGEDSDGYCNSLHSGELGEPINLYPLNARQTLAEAVCVNGAYQSSYLYAVLDSRLTHVEQVFPREYGGYGGYSGGGELSGSFKSRGLGDCWSNRTALWDGKTFVKSSESTTGQCRGFLGGAWFMPLFESRVVK